MSLVHGLALYALVLGALGGAVLNNLFHAAYAAYILKVQNGLANGLVRLERAVGLLAADVAPKAPAPVSTPLAPKV